MWIPLLIFVLALVAPPLPLPVAAALLPLALFLIGTSRRKVDPETSSLRVAFLHPDLGIGGAERLVVDAAVALQAAGHKVSVFTARHEKGHCFEETRDGTLEVTEYGNFLPRSVFGRFYAACAYLRMCWVALRVVLMQSSSPFDVIVVDQVSVCLPMVRFARAAGIIFYCHFPDKLLTGRDTLLKKAYRYPLDLAEECTTGIADVIFVNSKFTAGVFAEAFPILRRCVPPPRVLYPALNLDEQDRMETQAEDLSAIIPEDKIVLLSINRFERKKNIGLAIKALALMPEESRSNVMLVIAGGYDERLPENVEHAAELEALATKLGVENQVLQLRSVPAERKAGLLKRAACLLYTPDREHLGIVPLEAMYARVPVVAVNSGGPLETIVEGTTGFHCPPEPQAWASTLRVLLPDKLLRDRLGAAGRARVAELFSVKAFGQQLDETVKMLAGTSSSHKSDNKTKKDK
eukprot:CAMPEP_0206575526 /NCGR_PEP_ID=MMETSP0325_2-20121206/30131_1 /ASSEMBLY_ACC=CAM_ASM_000347 /TAXON_ID=2866 /ORGANISM="Crypthecodinium cohnii, Strain Seligo" /LENGTH=462 /DNA_ID=CAMNT_0054080413 /DNA_START=26 /DNA_END=1414 /DNA_ORIENTATION=-